MNTLTSMIMVMLAMGAVVASLLFIDDRKNGVMKQMIAYGISREKIFVGKCIVALGFSLIIMVAVLVIYVGSAYLLLREPEWLPLKEMLLGIGASLPMAAASLIFTLALGSWYKKRDANRYLVGGYFLFYSNGTGADRSESGYCGANCILDAL